MIYVMSDIHGCYDKYRKMLERIAFSKTDTLYILGDVVDRGPHGMQVLLDIAARDNVVLLQGNHDRLAGILLTNLYLMEEQGCSEELLDLYRMWMGDGGQSTLTEFLTLSEEDRITALEVLKNTKLMKELEVNGNSFLLAHTVPEVDRICDYEEWGAEDYLWGEPDYEEIYFDDKYVVTGHTPTGYIEEASKGKIWRGNNHIAIDCGAVFGYPLGCFCLDTFEEFYVG